MRAINPAIDVRVIHDFVTAENAAEIFGSSSDDDDGVDCRASGGGENGDDDDGGEQRVGENDDDGGEQRGDGRPRYDVVLDAVDGFRDKAAIIDAAARVRGTRVVTVGGAGGKRDATRVRADDLTRAQGDPMLAQVRRGAPPPALARVAPSSLPTTLARSQRRRFRSSARHPPRPHSFRLAARSRARGRCDPSTPRARPPARACLSAGRAP